MNLRFHFLLLLSLLLISACRQKTIVVPDNDPPYVGGVPQVEIENYVNKIFIDLIGREPLDYEMTAEVQWLKDNNLSQESRDSLMRKLQFNTDSIHGDSSYKHAYYHRLYELAKLRLCEGAANSTFWYYWGLARNSYVIDSLLGDQEGMAKSQAVMDRLEAVVDSERELMFDSIGLQDMYARMVNNQVYSVINMNTFNFINATFDDLFFRYPTTAEYDAAFDMIEFNLSTFIFNEPGSNKEDYIDIMVTSREFYEGMVRWAYITLVAREPQSAEMNDLMSSFYWDHDISRVQRYIMVTDEYANFSEL